MGKCHDIADWACTDALRKETGPGSDSSVPQNGFQRQTHIWDFKFEISNETAFLSVAPQRVVFGQVAQEPLLALGRALLFLSLLSGPVGQVPLALDFGVLE